MCKYASYRLAIRDNYFSILHRSQKLFLQWIVDMYVRIEGTRLHFVRTNQSTLRAEVYNNLTDFFIQNVDGDDRSVGRKIILPSTFHGSPRHMYQNYLDAMSIVQHFGKPSLFITMTCNPNWPEIKDNLAPGEQAHFRPDIVVRVFCCKLKELIDCLTKKHIFGLVDALIYVIEFQKRGLPHAHILLTLCSADQIETHADIDRVVCAEIPDINVDPLLHELVKKHMMHGPCGDLNPTSVCMSDGKCKKEFPKDFCESTRDRANGFPIYRRRDNGVSVDVRGSTLDNRFVVPYNPYLLAKFNCHINVEVCNTVRSVKYIYKYVYKGYDCASLEFGRVNNGANEVVQINEIDNFLNGRYVGSTEAAWRIFEYPMHFQSHAIIRLDCHLPERQTVYFHEGRGQEALSNVRNTKLLAFFELNRNDPSANNFLYTEIPLHYTWKEGVKKWEPRKQGGHKVIARLYAISPRNVELFHLRLLLLHVKGPKSFEDLRTYEGVIYPTFLEVCQARMIVTNEREWFECLNEAKATQSPKQLRLLFAYICAMNLPTNALLLFNEFKAFMSEDFLRDHTEEISFNRTLIEIEEVLLSHNLSCNQLGLPRPVYTGPMAPDDSNVINVEEEERIFNEMYSIANNEQREIIDRVVRETIHHDTGSNVFCLTAHAGCGKTFVQTAIIHKLNSLNIKCIPCAFSGIASTLLLGGRTLHNVFKLPIQIVENSVSSISANSPQAEAIKAAHLIIIDEVSMCPKHALRLIDRFLRDICGVDRLFGGKTILLCGDFRQTLPVIPHGSRVTLIENCVTSWHEFENFKTFTLTQNMRALTEEIEFVEFIKLLGNGELPTFPQLGDNVIEIPSHLLGNVENIIDDVYGDLNISIETSQILNSVILAPKNEDCNFINTEILNRLPGEEKTYSSYDTVISDDPQSHAAYPVEFLNSLTLSGFPSHKLVLKQNCIVLLIRNFNTGKGLVNGTRLRIVQMYRNTLDCEVLTGIARNTRILIPRIHLTYSGTILPFSFRRTQFPIIPAFAMTINKSQGQTFQKVGVLLRQPVFSHGQLYVAASRVRSFSGLKFYISDNDSGQGHLMNDDRVFTKNIVYREVILPRIF